MGNAELTDPTPGWQPDYLSDERVAALLEPACTDPAVARAIADFKTSWKAPLPPREITPALCASSVYVRAPRAGSSAPLTPDEIYKLEVAEVANVMKERLLELTRLAPELMQMYARYEAEAASKPVAVYGRPSSALVEYARLFPHHVRLGGCGLPDP